VREEGKGGGGGGEGGVPTVAESASAASASAAAEDGGEGLPPLREKRKVVGVAAPDAARCHNHMLSRDKQKMRANADLVEKFGDSTYIFALEEEPGRDVFGNPNKHLAKGIGEHLELIWDTKLSNTRFRGYETFGGTHSELEATLQLKNSRLFLGLERLHQLLEMVPDFRVFITRALAEVQKETGAPDGSFGEDAFSWAHLFLQAPDLGGATVFRVHQDTDNTDQNHNRLKRNAGWSVVFVLLCEGDVPGIYVLGDKCSSGGTAVTEYSQPGSHLAFRSLLYHQTAWPKHGKGFKALKFGMFFNEVTTKRGGR
jgi:hypothetical protein